MNTKGPAMVDSTKSAVKSLNERWPGACIDVYAVPIKNGAGAKEALRQLLQQARDGALVTQDREILAFRGVLLMHATSAATEVAPVACVGIATRHDADAHLAMLWFGQTSNSLPHLKNDSMFVLTENEKPVQLLEHLFQKDHLFQLEIAEGAWETIAARKASSASVAAQAFPVDSVAVPPTSEAVGVADQDAAIELSDPFTLDFSEELDERSVDEFLKQVPEAKTFLQQLNSGAALATIEPLIRALLDRFPDYWLPHGWAGTAYLRSNQVQQAKAVVATGIRRCKMRAYLYDSLARIAFAEADLAGVLGWSIKHCVACQQIGHMPQEQALLHLSEAACLLDHAIGPLIVRSLSTRFAPDYRAQLQKLCQNATRDRRTLALGWFTRFSSRYLEKTGSSKFAPAAKQPRDLRCPNCKAAIVVLEHERARPFLTCNCGNDAIANPLVGQSATSASSVTEAPEQTTSSSRVAPQPETASSPPTDAPTAGAPLAMLVRRCFVLAVAIATGWLAWGQQAPPGADWLQPTMNVIQRGFDDAELTPRVARGFVGAGAGALVAFLCGGALLRPVRFLAMIGALGCGAAAGWLLSLGASAAWFERELGIAGHFPTILVCMAAAALLLGLLEFVKPASPAIQAPSHAMATLWILVVPLVVVGSGWLAWGEAAPHDARWMQPMLDAIQGAFENLDLQPVWARVLVAAGVGGVLAFLLGGNLWRLGAVVSMLFLLGAGAGIGWLLTIDYFADPVARYLGVEGLPACMALGLGGAGVILGLGVWFVQFVALVPPTAEEVAAAHRSSATAIVCVCDKCKVRYVLGVNAAVVTMAEALNSYARLGSSRTVGGQAAGIPDSVALLHGQQSWPANKKPPRAKNSASDDAIREIEQAQRRGEKRKWQCNICKNIQYYDWSKS